MLFLALKYRATLCFAQCLTVCWPLKAKFNSLLIKDVGLTQQFSTPYTAIQIVCDIELHYVDILVIRLQPVARSRRYGNGITQLAISLIAFVLLPSALCEITLDNLVTIQQRPTHVWQLFIATHWVRGYRRLCSNDEQHIFYRMHGIRAEFRAMKGTVK